MKYFQKKWVEKNKQNTIICWLTGYNQQELQDQIDNKTILKPFSKKHLKRDTKVIFK
jgi:hypothetical protein